MDVGGQALRPSFVRVVREDHASVLHEGGHVGRFPPRSRSHIQNTLVQLRRERNDGEERGGGLEHVVAGEVFGCGTYNTVRVRVGHVVVVDLPIGTLLSKT